MTEQTPIGFHPNEIDTAAPTRAARLKWVVVVGEDLAPGQQVTAAICVAAATQAGVAGLLGAGATDAAGGEHVGLPWAGCSVLHGRPEQLQALRDRAAAFDGVFVADMPGAAQRTRVYDEYLAAVRAGGDFAYAAVSVVGPRNRVDKLTKGLVLLP